MNVGAMKDYKRVEESFGIYTPRIGDGILVLVQQKKEVIAKKESFCCTENEEKKNPSF